MRLNFMTLKNTNPKPGPPFMRSNTCAGLSSCLKRLRNFTPWLSPDFEFTNTNKGLQPSGQVASQASSLPMLCKEIGGTMDARQTPRGHFSGY